MIEMSRPRHWALITGVSEGGLGDALLTQFLSRSINVIATAPNINFLDYLPDDEEQIHKVELDVTNAESIATAVTKVISITGGKLHFLINNAGYGLMMPLLDVSITEAKKCYDVNVFGLLAVTQAFFPLLRAAPRGMVVNHSSIGGLPAGYQPFIGTYGSAKAAVTYLSDTMRVELEPFDVKVITLLTGDVGSNFWKNATTLAPKLPESSLYYPIKDPVEAMMRGETNPPGQHSRERWAKKVTDDLLKRNPGPCVRRGHFAVALSFVSNCVPRWMLDWAYARSSQLSTLKELLDRGQN